MRWKQVNRFAMAAVSFGVTASVLAADWPQWRGPNRDGKSTETGLLKTWPAGGPRLIWTAKKIGFGFSTVSIKDDLIYTTGVFGADLKVTALGLDGQQKWQAVVGPDWTGGHAGSRGIPTIDGEALYLYSGVGRLGTFDRKTGDTLWTLDLVKTFGGRVPQWGFGESVLIDGDRLICTPGARDATLVALDKKTGKTIWTSKGLSDPAGYASPILFEVGGVRQVASLTARGLVGVEAETGRFLWRYDRPASRSANCSDPLFIDGRIFGASGYDHGGGLAQLTAKDGQVTATQLWETKQMVNHHGGMVVVDGYIYGNHQNGWSCLDVKDGRQAWFAQGVGKGSIAYADGMLYCLSERTGAIALVKAAPKGYEEAGRFNVPDGIDPSQTPGRVDRMYWAHPVVCGGRLYLRHGSSLYCYDIRAVETPATQPKPVA
jgi:outer membrane protein assembly factor BamB